MGAFCSDLLEEEFEARGFIAVGFYGVFGGVEGGVGCAGLGF